MAAWKAENLEMPASGLASFQQAVILSAHNHRMHLLYLIIHPSDTDWPAWRSALSFA